MQHPVLSPLRIAWLAHMEFYVNRVAPMLQHAQEALRLAPPKHHCAPFLVQASFAKLCAR